jgi:hypothetical protein
MKRIFFIILIVFFLPLLAFTEEEGEFKEEEVDDADILAVLEEINEKLERLPDRFQKRKHDDPFKGVGGSLFYPTRIFFDMDDLNSYINRVGGYEDFKKVLVPFKDGWGGTFRLSFNKNWQIGTEVYFYGLSSNGLMNSTADPGVVDNDGDGKDDFYSYAEYNLGVINLIGQGKVELVKERLFFFGGIKAGFGKQTIDFTRNPSENNFGGNLSAFFGDASWKQFIMPVGGFVGLQFYLGTEKRFSIGLDTGFEYYIPITDWKPGTGVHKDFPAPPDDFNPMNMYIALGGRLHY